MEPFWETGHVDLEVEASCEKPIFVGSGCVCTLRGSERQDTDAVGASVNAFAYPWNNAVNSRLKRQLPWVSSCRTVDFYFTVYHF